MSARLEAAVKAWDHYWGDRYGDEALEEMGEEVQIALDAADEVMFSDERLALVALELAYTHDTHPKIRARMIANIFKGKDAA